MIDEAIKGIGGHKGCSQIALENYILAAHKKLNYKRRFLRASVKRGKANGTFLVHHNHKNCIKLPPKKKKTYGKMIEEAINFIGDNKGCSEIVLENYILASYKKINYKRRFLRTAITRGKANGTFIVHHNHKNNIKLSPTKPMKSKKRKRQTGETESPKKIKLSSTKPMKPKKRKRQTETELSPRKLRSFRKNSSTLVSFICLFLVYLCVSLVFTVTTDSRRASSSQALDDVETNRWRTWRRPQRQRTFLSLPRDELCARRTRPIL